MIRKIVPVTDKPDWVMNSGMEWKFLSRTALILILWRMTAYNCDTSYQRTSGSAVHDRLILHHNLTKAGVIPFNPESGLWSCNWETNSGWITFSLILHSFDHMFSGRAENASHAVKSREMVVERNENLMWFSFFVFRYRIWKVSLF